MKLVLILIIAILLIVGVSKIVDGMKLRHVLVTYNGRTCDYWEMKLWPDEYIHGWVYKYAKWSPRIDVRTGIDQKVTPPQAAAVIDWILESYPVTSDGATLSSSSERIYDDENRQYTMIWRFSKAPSRGVTAQTQQKMIDELLGCYSYIYVDKWPLKEQKFIDDNEEKAKQIVLRDLMRRGF